MSSVIDQLSNPTRRAALVRAESGPARFSDLMEATGITYSAKLAFHAKNLVREGLLVHEGHRYLITERGRQALRVVRSLEAGEEEEADGGVG